MLLRFDNTRLIGYSNKHGFSQFKKTHPMSIRLFRLRLHLKGTTSGSKMLVWVMHFVWRFVQCKSSQKWFTCTAPQTEVEQH